MPPTNKNRRTRKTGDGGFFGLPKPVIRHANFILLSAHAVKLIIDLGEQYLGKNNGNLCATWLFMQARGWKSKDTLNNALKELMYYGFIIQTQHGGLNRPTLYAFTWWRIDKASPECGFKVGQYVHYWKQKKTLYIKESTKKRKARKKKQVRLSGQSGTAIGAVSEKIRAIK